MESEVNYSTNITQSKSNTKLIVIIAVVAVAVVIGALLVSAFILIPQPQGQDAWLFKGAYATYEGSASISAEDLGSLLDMSMSIDFTVQQKIVDFNDTHALISTSFQMSSSFGEYSGDTEQNEESSWVPLSQMGLMTAFEEIDLTNSYESTVNIDGLGTRTCMVYEYEISHEGLALTVYVDKAIGWPLKMTMSMTNIELQDYGLELDINLVETNISALQ
ncbi:hypothetical protein E2P63_01430 [Candidatus Bathyarchaeota archaeon]|nr:hypothetical protein E2P63_01430 [Candidatus Bathyarchaeota archaeon]